VPVLIRMFFADRNDPPGSLPAPVKAPRHTRGVAEQLRKHTLTLVRAQHTANVAADDAPRSVLVQRTTHFAGTARSTHSSEPILVPKLRISFADFPYLHYSKQPEAVHLGDLLRIWVRPSTKITLSPLAFQGPTPALRTPQEPRCFTPSTSLSPGELISGSRRLTKKRQLFPGLAPTSPTLVALPHWRPKSLSP
jgi:hypothetical protein